MTATVARRIDHVAIAVHDADEAAQWYVEALGMEIVSDEVIESAFVRLVCLAPNVQHRVAGPFDATMLQLAQPVGPGRVDAFVRESGEGLHHLCWTVDDAASAMSELGDDPAGIFVGGQGRATCFLTQARNGVLVELAEPVS